MYTQNYFPCAIEEVLGKRNGTRKLENILMQNPSIYKVENEVTPLQAQEFLSHLTPMDPTKLNCKT